MNRNELFQTVSSVTMGRSKFDKSHSSIRSFNEGDLVPILCEEVIPGDTWDFDTNALIRSLTPIYPVMDNAKVDTYFFYCRNRNAWLHWKNFCGENNPSSWTTATNYSVPGMTVGQLLSARQSLTADGVGNFLSPYSLFSYMGACPIWDPTNMRALNGATTNSPTFVSVLPFRHYRQIWNDFFRNQNIQDPVLVNTGDTAAAWEYGGVGNTNAAAYMKTNGFLKAGRIADYFSSGLPQPQRGPAVSLPLVGGPVPVVTKKTTAGDGIAYDSTRQTLKFVSNNNVMVDSHSFQTLSLTQQTGLDFTSAQVDGIYGLDQADDMGNTITGVVQPSNLEIDLSAVDAVSINALRLAFACQRWFEKLGRAGGRYFEVLRASWGVITSDAVMQMPEYIGGASLRLDNRQVLQTSSDANDSPLGSTGAYSLTNGRTGKFVKSCDEHGFIIGLCVLRVERSYSQGIPAFLQRKSFFSYYTPELAHIGEQQIKKSELYVGGGSTSDDPFAYKEAWTEYRFSPNTIKGMMDPALQNGYQAWSYGDAYSGSPTLSDTWFKEDESRVDQTLKIQALNNDGSVKYDVQQFFGSFFFNVKVTRVMPVRSTPGLIDHF